MVHARRNRLLLSLIAERRATVRSARALAEVHLGRAHPNVGALGEQLAELDAAARDLAAELRPHGARA